MVAHGACRVGLLRDYLALCELGDSSLCAHTTRAHSMTPASGSHTWHPPPKHPASRQPSCVHRSVLSRRENYLIPTLRVRLI